MKKMKSKLISILLGVIFLLGIGILAYPTVSDWWNNKHATKAIASYVEEVEKIDDSEQEEILQIAKKYNDALQAGVHLNLTEEEYEVYENILDISGTGIMGYVQIPSINVNLPIYHGTDENVLQVAIGHIPGSSFPIGGDSTHAIISGHRGLPSAKLFTDLDKMVVGDVFLVTVLHQVVTYQVDQIHIVTPDEVSDLAIEPGKDYMTLVTCTPYGVNSHRMLVRGHRIENLAEHKNIVIVSEARRISKTLVFFSIAIPLLIIAMVVSVLLGKKKRYTKDQMLRALQKREKEKGEKDE